MAAFVMLLLSRSKAVQYTFSKLQGHQQSAEDAHIWLRYMQDTQCEDQSCNCHAATEQEQGIVQHMAQKLQWHVLLVFLTVSKTSMYGTFCPLSSHILRRYS